MRKNIEKDLNTLLKAQCSLSQRAEKPVCRALAHAGILLSSPNPEQAARFFLDFGLEMAWAARDAVWLKGGGESAPSVKIRKGPAVFEGIVLRVGAEVEMQTLGRHFGVPIQAGDPIRGGRMLELQDPDGLRVQVVAEERSLQLKTRKLSRDFNEPGKPLRVNQTQRPAFGSPLVHKLGHTVMGVKRMNETLKWYQENFGFIVSDFQMIDGDPVPVVLFLRCDRGETPSDHHTIALTSGVDLGHMHTAFELQDLDSLARGHELLHKRGYKHSWGVGRHKLGSQIFDYWRHPSGEMFEHYIDGDLFDSSQTPGYHDFHKDAQHQWGPDISADMLDKKPSLKRIRTIWSRICSSDDLTPSRLVRMVKATL